MSPAMPSPDIPNSRFQRFASACKTALKHPGKIMASGLHEGDAITISDDDDEVSTVNHEKPG